jgi:hypothetical protein
MAIKKPGLPKSFTDRLEFCGLTEEEKAEIKDRAMQQVATEKRARAEEKFFEAALQDARREDQPVYQIEDVFIDLPGHAVHIMIDGVEFLHGFSYEVNKPQADTIREMVQRAWNHEDEVGGANRNFYDKPRNVRLTRRSNVTTRHLQGV